ncbi:hypothetical protein MJM04_29805, partial [Salmonella enterica subsp. enterica serovar Cerro]|nr:hypothetical protein [Salmonella enterica subsp. enterica serovar Cerro]
RQSWQWRENNPMWLQLHSHLGDTLYRKEWLVDHKQILAALIKMAAYGERFSAPANVVASILNDDRKGRKNGRGFYLYGEKGRKSK